MAGTGEWCDRLGRQSPMGGKMNDLSDKKICAQKFLNN
jgi:hypothetical protein